MNLGERYSGLKRNPERIDLRRAFVIDDQLNPTQLEREIPVFTQKFMIRYKIPNDPSAAHYYIPTRRKKDEIDEVRAKLREQDIFVFDNDVFLDRIFIVDLQKYKGEGYVEFREDEDSESGWART